MLNPTVEYESPLLLSKGSKRGVQDKKIGDFIPVHEHVDVCYRRVRLEVAAGGFECQDIAYADACGKRLTRYVAFLEARRVRSTEPLAVRMHFPAAQILLGIRISRIGRV
jgi:hypothetical protein